LKNNFKKTFFNKVDENKNGDMLKILKETFAQIDSDMKSEVDEKKNEGCLSLR
jgi:hypothetical protein